MRTEAFTRRRDGGQKSNGEARRCRRRSWSPPKPSSHPCVPPPGFFSFLPRRLGGCEVRGQVSLSWVCEVSQDHQRLPLFCKHLTGAGQQGLRNDGLNDQEWCKVGVAQASQASASSAIRGRKASGHKVAAAERKTASSLSMQFTTARSIWGRRGAGNHERVLRCFKAVQKGFYS